MRYCDNRQEPVRRSEIDALNQAIQLLGYKIPDLWDQRFLNGLAPDGTVVSQQSIPSSVQLSEDAQERAAQLTSRLLTLGTLRTTFYSLWSMDDRQAAGSALETLLNELFRTFDLDPHEAFRVTGEQIDGAFELDRETYLLEAKWHKEKVNESDLLIFRGKIEGKSNWTRGVFVSINGFTTGAIEAITIGKTPNHFLMTGDDLVAVLEGAVGLDALLRAKQRRLAERGQVFLSVRDHVLGNN